MPTLLALLPATVLPRLGMGLVQFVGVTADHGQHWLAVGRGLLEGERRPLAKHERGVLVLERIALLGASQ